MTKELNPQAIHAFIEKPSLMRRLSFGCLVPILLAQGFWVRHAVPKIAEAKGPRHGVTGSGKPIRILVAGDSSAAGVGAPIQAQALVGCLLSRLAVDFTVHWKLIANTGWSTPDLRSFLHTVHKTSYDIVLTATGMNDITSRQSMAACLLEQIKLVKLLREKFAVGHVLVSGLPPVHRFPLLPEPLRGFIGDRAKRLDNAIQSWSREQPDCDHIRLDFPVSTGKMAPDGFHPGPGIYALWADAAAVVIRARWK
ncbi:SGNH/GDSL hydrolase family protein [uncultured Desulfosarcina sp.]|uniref:SGNH/GDSL hydrolase family protein n=1 Tax=uncultured Desulfosarcina sp. TaxID=218289 RepID=UPI0029C641BA|nr:SGNH/GDSL hydrolase family protein [uncultured Desulfosarcina sp.]